MYGAVNAVKWVQPVRDVYKKDGVNNAALSCLVIQKKRVD